MLSSTTKGLGVTFFPQYHLYAYWNWWLKINNNKSKHMKRKWTSICDGDHIIWLFEGEYLFLNSFYYSFFMLFSWLNSLVILGV